MVEIDLRDWIGFVVTGKYAYSNRSFKAMHYGATVSGFRTAFSINLWRGNVWGVRPDGTRKRLKSVYN